MERETQSVAEVAARLGVHENTIRNWVRSGEVPAIRLGRKVLVPRVVIDRLLDRPGPASAKAAAQ